MPTIFQEMDCFVLAGGRSNRAEDFQQHGELTRLERGYRRYAAIFEKVTLVLKSDQARERYLNYPHVCDESPELGVAIGIEAALKNSESDAVFIGSTDIADFPLELLVELVKNYQGDAFLGYQGASDGSAQPFFGIYSKKLAPKLNAAMAGNLTALKQMIAQEGRLIPLPTSTLAEQLNLR